MWQIQYKKNVEQIHIKIFRQIQFPPSIFFYPPFFLLFLTHSFFSKPYEILNHDPWKKDGVKFIPFHGYLRKQLANQGCKHSEQSRCLLCKSLDPPSYKVKPCNKHPPYPDGICTDCKPSECRIDSQSYRHVDNVEFQVKNLFWLLLFFSSSLTFVDFGQQKSNILKNN